MGDHVGGAIHMLHNMLCRDNNHPPRRDMVEQMTGNHSYILCFLYDRRDRDIFQRDLEKHLMLRRSSATGALQTMERNGLIERVSVASDARLKKIVLTQKAIELNQIIRDDIEDNERRLTAGLTPEEIANFWCVVDKLKANLEKGLYPESMQPGQQEEQE